MGYPVVFFFIFVFSIQLTENKNYWRLGSFHWSLVSEATVGQSYKHFTLVNYDSSVVIWGIFQLGTTLEL